MYYSFFSPKREGKKEKKKWGRREVGCEEKLGTQDVFSSSLVKGGIWFLQYLNIELKC